MKKLTGFNFIKNALFRTVTGWTFLGDNWLLFDYWMILFSNIHLIGHTENNTTHKLWYYRNIWQGKQSSMVWTAIIKSTEDWQHGLTSQGRLIGLLVSRGIQFTAHPNSRHPNRWCWQRPKGRERGGKQTQRCCCCCWTDFLSSPDMVLKLRIWYTGWSSLVWSFWLINFTIFFTTLFTCLFTVLMPSIA